MTSVSATHATYPRFTPSQPSVWHCGSTWACGWPSRQLPVTGLVQSSIGRWTSRMPRYLFASFFVRVRVSFRCEAGRALLCLFVLRCESVLPPMNGSGAFHGCVRPLLTPINLSYFNVVHWARTGGKTAFTLFDKHYNLTFLTFVKIVWRRYFFVDLSN